MTTEQYEDQYNQPNRKAYISESGLFVFFAHRGEFGTNLRHPATRELALAALKGVDTFIDRHHDDPRWAAAHIEEDVGPDGEAVGFRMADLVLLEEGMKAALGLPYTELSSVTRSLIDRASRDLHAFLYDLACNDFLPHHE